MTSRLHAPERTREHRPPTDEQAHQGRPVLLASFPRSVSLDWPATGADVGRTWLASAGTPDEEVSTRHLRFHRTGARVEIEDLRSTNGTFVDGYRIAPGERVALEDGVIVRLGKTIIVYREALMGPKAPDPPLGKLVGPWGLRSVRAEIERLPSQRVWNLLLLGESGTGKELLAGEVARALRPQGPFGDINVAAVPADRVEAELFGWEKGAFTGSVHAHPGLIRACKNGVAFLDEIGELPIALQPKLLRLLENHHVQPLGAGRAELVDVVIVAATNRPLDDEIKLGRFRLDVHERFGVRLSLPRLADRPEDLFAIFAHLYERIHGPLDLASLRVDVEAVELLMLHDWPGNVRALDRLVHAIDPQVGLKRSVACRVLDLEAPTKAPPLTREAIEGVLAKHDYNQSQAARVLEVPRARLLRTMKKLGIGASPGKR